MTEKAVSESLVCFRRSRLEINVQILSCLASFAVAGILLAFSGPFRLPWGLLASGLGIGLAALFLVKTISSLEKVYWDPKAHLLRFHRAGRIQNVPLLELTRIRTYPAWGRTVLRWGERRKIFLHHQILGAQSILKTIQGVRPDLFPDPEETLKLRTSLLSLFILIFFTVGVFSAGALLSIYWPGFVVVGLLCALPPFVRIFLFAPLKYQVNRKGIRVRFLLRSRFFPRESLKNIAEDTYAASGCNYYLMKFLFQGGTVILDEGTLMSPLKSRSGWIYDTLQLDDAV